ncbi:Mobile element protein [Candidatus Enterovibrio escicola]|uniref:Mutator family transposase n=1 Tax=Candidatus Enterovibrio escicola TaxID=1927127 RepID=A0A2A5T6I0_9GAMM|nr:Mobile element protein [Candidatus Enterovibrio escacola]
MDDKLFLLVVIGVDDAGRKEVFSVVDGAFGFWNAVAKYWPTSCHQRCWVHKTVNALNTATKSVQPKIKETLHDIWMAETQEEVQKAFGQFETRYGAKYPKAAECLTKDKVEIRAFYDFPSEHWTHIRTTNPIKSMFATVRLRMNNTKNCESQKTTLQLFVN